MSIRDVLIIGAGAAGSTAAFHLAKSGKYISLLEKNPQLIAKPCGGGMSSSVQEWLPFDLKPIVDDVIKKIEFSWCLSDKVIADLSNDEPFWIVRREELDGFLRTKAINAGAELIKPFNVNKLAREKNIWKVSSQEGEELEAKSIIIADGSTSPWPKLFNLGPRKERYASTISIRLNEQGNIENGTARFEFGLVPNGFAWAFPLQGGINIGIGSFLGQNQTINSDLILKKLLPDFGFSPNDGIKVEVPLRIWNGHNNLHNEGILAIGDAASLCDPFLAEGIRPALMSGYEAANCLTNWLNGDITTLNSYTQIMRKKWSSSMAWGNRISQIFYRFPKVGYQLGVKRSTAPKRITQILSGEMNYEDIAQRVIKRLLFNR